MKKNTTDRKRAGILPYGVEQPKSFSEIVAANVRAEASRRGMRQADLARALGWTAPRIGSRWNGGRSWKLDELAQLSQLLRVPVDNFVRTENNPARWDSPAGFARPEGLEPPTFWLGAYLKLILVFTACHQRAFEA